MFSAILYAVKKLQFLTLKCIVLIKKLPTFAANFERRKIKTYVKK